jgi:hypothetical protein
MTETTTVNQSGEMLAKSGQAWSISEEVVEAMREVQAALLRGDTREAVSAYRRGRRLADRITVILAETLG